MEIKGNNFPRNRFLGLENIHLDLFYCFLRHLQAKICKILDFGGHLGKMADRKKCSTFGVWLQTDLDSAAQNLMETIIKVYICLKTRFSYQMLGSLHIKSGSVLDMNSENIIIDTIRTIINVVYALMIIYSTVTTVWLSHSHF